MIAATQIAFGRAAGEKWHSPYPVEDCVFAWSEKIGKPINVSQLASVLVPLYNDPSTSFTLDIACKSFDLTSSGLDLIWVRDEEESWYAPLRIRTRNAGSTDAPNQRPYMMYDGAVDWNTWTGSPRRAAMSCSPSGVMRCLNTKYYSADKTRTMTAVGVSVGEDYLSSVLVYSKALDKTELSVIYDIHSSEFGW